MIEIINKMNLFQVYYYFQRLLFSLLLSFSGKPLLNIITLEIDFKIIFFNNEITRNSINARGINIFNDSKYPEIIVLVY